jgi:hypothetical protein
MLAEMLEMLAQMLGQMLAEMLEMLAQMLEQMLAQMLEPLRCWLRCLRCLAQMLCWLLRCWLLLLIVPPAVAIGQIDEIEAK